MSFGIVLVAVIAIIAFSAIRIARYRAGLGDPDGRHELDAGLGQEPTAREIELYKEVEELRQRIGVLERIATDDRHSKAVAAEIESLRDS